MKACLFVEVVDGGVCEVSESDVKGGGVNFLIRLGILRFGGSLFVSVWQRMMWLRSVTRS